MAPAQRAWPRRAAGPPDGARSPANRPAQAMRVGRGRVSDIAISRSFNSTSAVRSPRHGVPPPRQSSSAAAILSRVDLAGRRRVDGRDGNFLARRSNPVPRHLSAKASRPVATWVAAACSIVVSVQRGYRWLAISSIVDPSQGDPASCGTQGQSFAMSSTCRGGRDLVACLRTVQGRKSAVLRKSKVSCR